MEGYNYIIMPLNKLQALKDNYRLIRTCIYTYMHVRNTYLTGCMDFDLPMALGWTARFLVLLGEPSPKFCTLNRSCSVSTATIATACILFNSGSLLSEGGGCDVCEGRGLCGELICLDSTFGRNSELLSC